MPVPQKLLHVENHVFCYDKELLAEATDIANHLGCNISRIYDGKLGPGAEDSKTAWIVGYGAKKDSKVYSAEYKIGDISDWLQMHDYTYLVDTCCNQDTRKRYQKFETNYYCTIDDQSVVFISDHNTLDAWWEASNMHQLV